MNIRNLFTETLNIRDDRMTLSHYTVLALHITQQNNVFSYGTKIHGSVLERRLILRQ